MTARYLVISKLGGMHIDNVHIIDATSESEARKKACQRDGLIPEAAMKYHAMLLDELQDGWAYST